MAASRSVAQQAKEPAVAGESEPLPVVDESQYPDRSYAEAITDEHRTFLQENHPEQLPK